mgnify:CR=1 FL=1
MSEIQKNYLALIKAVDGRRIPIKDILADSKSRLANAGVAVASVVMSIGDIRLQKIKKEIPDFTNSEIRIVLANLRKGKYFVKVRGRYWLEADKGSKKGTDAVWWGLLGAVAAGWIERSNEKYRNPKKK